MPAHLDNTAASTVSPETGESDGPHSSRSVKAKDAETFKVPMREISTIESCGLGFRFEMFDVVSDDGERMGSAASGGGCGNDWLILSWRDRTYAFAASELLKRLVARDFPEDLHHFDENGIK